MSVRQQHSCKVKHHEDSQAAYVTHCCKILRALKTPLASRLADSYYSNPERIAHCKMPDPNLYADASSFARDYLAYGLLRKSVDLPIEVDKQSACIQKWMQTEETCKSFNRANGFKPRHYVHGPLEGSPSAVILTASAKIRALLGTFDWNEANSLFGFSGGASTRLPRRNGHPFYKFSGKPEVTRNAALLAVCTIWHSPLWRASMQDQFGPDPVNWVTIVEGSRFTTVGKTATIDRGICIEPDMNMFMQRGIGAMIRKRLRNVRVDLNDQTRNQRLARIGSSTGSLATIDLASASDSVSLAIVKQLLPHDWYEAMLRTRSETVIFDNGVKHSLEKISSMGNGFTFELESLIFWALSSACLDLLEVADKRLGVYGDDIVIHHSAADALISALACAGFETNVDKTFVSGPFRESCGKHYFYGQDVTPFYVKSQTGACQTDLFWLANSFNDWASRIGGYGSTVAYLREACRRKGVLDCVPRDAGLRAGYIVELSRAKPTFCKRRQMYRYACWKPERSKFRPNGIAAYLYALASPCADDVMVVEKGELRMRRRSAYTSAWSV